MLPLISALMSFCLMVSSSIAPPAQPEPTPPPPLAVESPVDAYPSAQPHDLTILMYHHLVEDEKDVQGNPMIVTAQRFAQDLDWLVENGYTTVLPRDLVEGVPLPEKAVMISFDDGYASNFHLAFPLLEERGMKATIALICTKLDQGASDYLSWDMCREMVQSGLVEFTSHTYNLHNLDQRLGAYVPDGSNGIQRLAGESQEAFQARVLPDLELSVQRIEEELGTDVLCFVYPYGAKDAWASPYIAQNFAMTLVTTPGAADLSQGFYSLPRMTVTMKQTAAQCFGP